MTKIEYVLDISDERQKMIRKFVKQDPQRKIAVDKALRKILQNPYGPKPLRYDMKNKRRIHLLEHFVMVYKIDGNLVIPLDIDHHDKIYGR
ncbi:MAG: type II toxin-antitoxin system RelE/ParE family toxin [DPANN group archaeon]|nr:type II toxin-antitoxin system RelE/ParE family toxin [DPANN group archaeon]